MEDQCNSPQLLELIGRSTAYIRSSDSRKPSVCIILGSGLGAFADRIPGATSIPYEVIPGFHKPSIEGHEGRLVLTTLQGLTVAVLIGRIHYYEGYPLPVVTLPIRVMHALGVRTVILTNAAGAVNPSFEPRELMLIRDHINLMKENPLRGWHTSLWGPRFPDLSNVYSENLRQRASSIADQLGFKLFSGVYAALSGPSYETPAEVKMLSILGADAVGMSTVPEAIVAAQMGCTVLGISGVANLAAGLSSSPLTHEEVQANGRECSKKLVPLLEKLLESLAHDPLPTIQG